MAKVAVVYWSGTGNTEIMAQSIAQGVQEAGGEADIVAAASFDAAKVDDYDAYAFGCPAMGAEELEDLEFAPMYDEVEPKLSGRSVALFGSYDWGTGEWMDLWRQRAIDAGVDVVDTLIAHNTPDDEAKAECVALGGKLA